MSFAISHILSSIDNVLNAEESTGDFKEKATETKNIRQTKQESLNHTEKVIC